MYYISSSHELFSASVVPNLAYCKPSAKVADTHILTVVYLGLLNSYHACQICHKASNCFKCLYVFFITINIKRISDNSKRLL